MRGGSGLETACFLADKSSANERVENLTANAP